MTPHKQKATILIVEDETALLNNIASILELSGYVCIKTSSGSEALAVLSNNNPDIIICDVMMAPMDGFQLIALIRENKQTINIPVIFLTARADLKDKNKGLELGAKAYLTKPFNVTELIQMIQFVLSNTEA